jgi:hypothetical protein
MTTTSGASSGNTARYGWRYSLFAGIVAFPIAAGVMLVLGRGDMSWSDAAILTVAAVIAARLGGWLALLSGGRDHGIRAGAFTAVGYALLCGILVQTSFAFRLLFEPSLERLTTSERWQLVLNDGVPAFIRDFVIGSIVGALFIAGLFGWLIVFACMVGTLLFQRIIRRRRGAYDRELRR